MPGFLRLWAWEAWALVAMPAGRLALLVALLGSKLEEWPGAPISMALPWAYKGYKFCLIAGHGLLWAHHEEAGTPPPSGRVGASAALAA